VFPEVVLHDNRPDVYTEVEYNNGEETILGTTTLADALQVKDEAETETADNTEEGRYEGREGASADAEVCCKVG
jgi:hypothetical protein